ncbi:MAG: ABC transporter substrate-binding protein [Chloroflexi bacterium]|nr:ABC transporter substrate-binding protein [Chloroflexota bacterium]
MNKLFLRVLSAMLVLVLVVPGSLLAQDEMAQMGDDIVEACPAPQNLPDTVTIGALFTLSGGASVFGQVQQLGVELAVEEINAAEYLGQGRVLEVIFEDSASDNTQAINAMVKLVEEDRVTAVLGPTLSREAFSADPVAQDAGTPVMGVSNTATGITDMGEFVFRNSLPESAVIPGTVAQAAEILGINSAAIIYANDDDFTVSGFDVFEQTFADLGIEVVGVETYATGDVDFNTQLTNIISANPDLIAISALAVEAVQIILQAQSLGYEGALMGGNGLNSPAVLEQTGDASEGLIVGAAWNVAADNPLSVAFIDAYEAANDLLPDQFAAQAYTGAWLMATAIRCADSVDGAAVRDALAGITDFDTPLGLFSFDEDRNPVHDPVAQVNRGGAFAVLTAEMMDDEG